MTATPGEVAVAVVVPTRNRASYLDVALKSLMEQDFCEPFEVIVADDASDDATQDVIQRFGVRSLRNASSRGPNAGRNRAIHLAKSKLVVLIDDDVYAPTGWLKAMVEGARRYPEADVLGGPIRAQLDRAPRGCGRDLPPITTLDLGPDDLEAEFVWGANMLLRRDAFDRVGPFDEDLQPGGDEDEWVRRVRADGGKVMYIASAGLDHRRAGKDSRLFALMLSAYRRGRHLHAYDRAQGVAPSVGRELRVLAACGAHTVRRRCPQGVITGAQSLGRTVEAVRSSR